MTVSTRYRVEVARRARPSLRTLRRARQLLERIDQAIQKLGQEPRPPGSKKLVGQRFQNLYRVRVGDWRILYAIEDERLVVLVLEVVRRDQAYRAG